MGKSSPDPPDYSPLAEASKESAEIMAALGREQLDFARAQYQDARPVLQGIAESQLAIQDQTAAQARDYYNYGVNTFRPVERMLVQEADRFNSDAYREQLASQAAADTSRAWSTMRGASERGLASMGVNPNSPRFAATQRQEALGLSASRAAAMNSARTQAQNLGYARRLDVAGLGRGLPGTSAAAYGLSVNAGNAAGQNYQSPGQNYMAGQVAGANTIGQGQNMRISGLSNILNAQTNAYVNGGGDGLGDILGGVGTLVGGVARAAPLLGFSDRRLKQDISFLGRDNLSGVNLYAFSFKSDPKRRFIGVMADEIEQSHPYAVIRGEDGYLRVNYAALGLKMKELDNGAA